MKSKTATLLALALLTHAALDARTAAGFEQELVLKLRYQKESSADSGRFHRLTRNESWLPKETAVIVCDVWDLHHCLNAVRRAEEFAPRLDKVLRQAREQGMTIIHSPSSCMDAYKDHPARKRAIDTPKAAKLPHEINSWCSVIPAEERGTYPIDQSDGGEDDDPEEHEKWAAKLKSMGRNPGAPWKKQSDLITIDSERDFISDRGDEVWSILEQRGIRNVILTGVHTNMCVLGRPFGLRQMARNGRNVVLMRDMTDTMYNPQRWPYVSHFTGTDLIVSHIEKYVCPTITSDQFIGGESFQFKHDARPHLVIVMAEDEYETNHTLPEFAVKQLGKDFRVSLVFGNDHERNSIPGLDVLDDADALLVSIRRRVLPAADMERVKKFIRSGKPVIGVRTASHAFSLRGKPFEERFADWPEFDAEVFGGNYHGHLGNKIKSTVRIAPDASDHPVLTGIPKDPFPQGYSLYEVSPLNEQADVLLIGRAEGHPEEPVAWTFERKDGGRSFYSSLGHPRDFERPEFVRLLSNGIRWAAGQEIEVSKNGRQGTVGDALSESRNQWSTIRLPPASDAGSAKVLEGHEGPVWFRCAVRIPSDWTRDVLIFGFDRVENVTGAWLNGTPLVRDKETEDATAFEIPMKSVIPADANLLVFRVDAGNKGGVQSVPMIAASRNADEFDIATLPLKGVWQFRTGDDASYASMPLPAKFGASADIVFAPDEPLFVARPFTAPHSFTGGIEGPACDREGNIFAVNYERQSTIGRVTSDGSAELFVVLPEGSTGNGIRFDRDGFFYVADYPAHNVLRVDPKTRKISTFAHNKRMNQPNDLAIAPDGTLYASDPNWGESTGQLWRIDRDGSTTRLAADMGTTNGIEVSPDGKTLYVNESVQRNVWAFTITDDKTLTDKRLVRRFKDHGFDGMRCDVDGNLYVTRHGKGTVVKLTPGGKILQEINVLGTKPSNICFGGQDGCTAYVTEMEYGRLVQFRVDRPGLASTRWQ